MWLHERWHELFSIFHVCVLSSSFLIFFVSSQFWRENWYLFLSVVLKSLYFFLFADRSSLVLKLTKQCSKMMILPATAQLCNQALFVNFLLRTHRKRRKIFKPRQLLQGFQHEELQWLSKRIFPIFGEATMLQLQQPPDECAKSRLAEGERHLGLQKSLL